MENVFIQPLKKLSYELLQECKCIPKIFFSFSLYALSNISFTPNQTLGRMIYDFSCTATEIGEANIQNYKLYEIQDFGD